MAKVSIIIPTYNVEDYLVQCMESVTRQTLKDIEIICINDGSTDGSLEILKSYAEKDNRIVLIDKINEGYGIGMNVGLDRATGEYIGIVEPDDFVPLNMYEDLYNKAKEFDLDFVKADFFRFKTAENGDMSLAYNHLSGTKEDYNKVFDPSNTPDALRYIMNTWSGIYKKSFLDEHHIRHHETPGASFQDNGFWFQTFVFGKRAMILDKPYYMNRRDNPNSSVSNPNKVYCMNIEYDYIREILMEYPDIWEKFKYMYWFKKYGNYMNTIQRISLNFRKEYIYRFSQEFKRGEQLGELSKDVFDDFQWGRIQLIMNNPDGYYSMIMSGVDKERMRELEQKAGEYDRIRNLEPKLNSLEHEFNDMRNSVSFRTGRAITSIPRMVRDTIKNKKK